MGQAPASTGAPFHDSAILYAVQYGSSGNGAEGVECPRMEYGFQGEDYFEDNSGIVYSDVGTPYFLDTAYCDYQQGGTGPDASMEYHVADHAGASSGALTTAD